jgi:hypothetical protein
VFHPTILP